MTPETDEFMTALAYMAAAKCADRPEIVEAIETGRLVVIPHDDGERIDLYADAHLVLSTTRAEVTATVRRSHRGEN